MQARDCSLRSGQNRKWKEDCEVVKKYQTKTPKNCNDIETISYN